jgi:hypothetical protein
MSIHRGNHTDGEGCVESMISHNPHITKLHSFIRRFGRMMFPQSSVVDAEQSRRAQIDRAVAAKTLAGNCVEKGTR